MNPYCIPNTSITPDQRDYARALLVSLGEDPSPSNVNKLSLFFPEEYTGGVGILMQDQKYTVYKSGEIYQLLEWLFLRNPFSLPAKYLALFIAHEFQDLEFEDVTQIAENFILNPTPESLWVLRKLMEGDKFLHAHIKEMMDLEFAGVEVGLSKVMRMHGNSAKRVCYKDEEYWVVHEK